MRTAICEGQLRELLTIKAMLAVAPRRENHSIFSRGVEFFSTESDSKELSTVCNGGSSPARD